MITHFFISIKCVYLYQYKSDSFGNAIPGYLFYSFEDLYVVDFRYFQENILEYIREHQITDLLIVNNIQHAYTRTTARSLVEMLERPITHKD